MSLKTFCQCVCNRENLRNWASVSADNHLAWTSVGHSQKNFTEHTFLVRIEKLKKPTGPLPFHTYLYDSYKITPPQDWKALLNRSKALSVLLPCHFGRCCSVSSVRTKKLLKLIITFCIISPASCTDLFGHGSGGIRV